MPPTRRLSRTWRFAVILLCILLSTLAVPPAARAQAPTPAGPAFQISLLAADATSAVLQLTVDRYHPSPVVDGDRTYTLIDIPGMARAAQESAPSHGMWLAVPTPEGASVTVLEAEYETMPGVAPPARPSLGSSLPFNLFDEVVADLAATDPASPGAASPGDALLAAPVAIAGHAYVRNQALLHLVWQPVHYDAVQQEIRVARRVRMAVHWPALALAAAGPPNAPGPWFDSLLRAAVLNPDGVAAPQPAILAASAVEAASPGLPIKLVVTAPGVYTLSPDDLAAAGVDAAQIDPRTLQLFNRGRELDIRVEGQEDGRFDSADRLLFYGQGIPVTAPEDVYTGENIYWLGWGSAVGRRMAERDGTPNLALSPAPAFTRHVHAEEDAAYWQTMPPGAGADRWFWGGRLSPNTAGMPVARPYSLFLPQPAPGTSPASLRVRLQGYTTGAHRTRLLVNGSVVGERSWQGQVMFEHATVAPQGFLRHGANEIVVAALDSGASVDQILVDWIEVDYAAAYAATDDRLDFGTPVDGMQRFDLAGFSQPDVLVFDISDPEAPVQIANASATPIGGGYTLSLATHAGQDADFLALTTDQVRKPDRIVRDEASQWRSPQHGADYILITHGDFYTATLALAAHRQGQGLRVATVKVDDLYDEFADGLFHPAAIRDFLAYAYAHWTPPAPSFVVLVGDAYQDYRDRLGRGVANFVPSQVVETGAFGEVSSDTWFVSFVGDDVLPDMWVGRLPARTVAEVNTLVQKLIAYDGSPAAAWNRNVLLIADDDDPAFGQIADDLAARLPVDYAQTRIEAASYGPGDPTVDIQASLNLGAVLATYVGHGEYFRWGAWSGGVIFHADDVDRLDNSARLPVISVANCLSGFYAGPAMSIAEEFVLHPHGGAVAVWAPGSLGHPAGHRALMGAFYSAIFRDDHTELGAAVAAAQLATLAYGPSWAELIQTYALLGDPATALRLAPNPPRITAVEPPDGAVHVPFDAPLRITFSKRMDPVTLTLTGLDGLAPGLAWNDSQTGLRADHAGFAPGQTLNPAVAGTDSVGNRLVAGPIGSTWSFTASSDGEPPAVSIHMARDEAGAIAPSAPVTLTFSEAVRQAQVQVAITPAPGESTHDEESPSWTLHWVDAAQASVEHATFADGETYTVMVGAVQDLAGNRMAAPAAASFTVGTSADRPAVYLPLVTR